MSIIKHVTLQKIVAHDFRYVPRKYKYKYILYTDIHMFVKHTDDLEIFTARFFF